MNSDSRTTEINLINNTTSAPQNITFEFYLSLPNDTRIYHVTYTELNSMEIARLLNNRIDLSHIPDHQLPFHYNYFGSFPSTKPRNTHCTLIDQSGSKRSRKNSSSGFVLAKRS
ncbi:hypothetical protein RhiirC2_788330 [Rhizophagus irregularis]|uniref:Uncharacterized protein n=1 Tax=Rhizophagus irregularis TaxID=588596 RepID=A0A2N1MQD0_9GLOM|nr:hypothetical protein RhiirC2_788330 [Rhizophagus irregularis]